jgi:hypothetical protein
MMTRFSRNSRRFRRRRSCSPRLEALEVRWTLSQTLPADGTIVVTTSPDHNPTSLSGLVEVNPATGAQSVLSSGGDFVFPFDVREAPNDTLYVADYLSQNSGAVIAVDPSNGAQRVVASGGYIDGPFAIQYMKGHVFLADSGTVLGTTPNVLEINPSTGKQTLITQGGNLVAPVALQPGPGNTIYVADFVTDDIFRVDLHTGAQTLIASGGYLHTPEDMATDSSGNLIVVGSAGAGSPGFSNVVSVDPRTGNQTLISTGGLLINLAGDSIDRAGNIFLSGDPSFLHGTPPRILEVDPSTGAQSIVSTSGFLDGATGQVVFYHNNDQGHGDLTASDAAAAKSGPPNIAGDPGIALTVALVTKPRKGLHASLLDWGS